MKKFDGIFFNQGIWMLSELAFLKQKILKEISNLSTKSADLLLAFAYFLHLFFVLNNYT